MPPLLPTIPTTTTTIPTTTTTLLPSTHPDHHPAPRQVQRKRPIVQPNPTFLMALALYEVRVHGFSSVVAGLRPSLARQFNFPDWDKVRWSLVRAPPAPKQSTCVIC